MVSNEPWNYPVFDGKILPCYSLYDKKYKLHVENAIVEKSMENEGVLW